MLPRLLRRTQTNVSARLQLESALKTSLRMSIFQKIKLNLLQTIEKLGESARDNH
jgi:hypothetical protein